MSLNFNLSEIDINDLDIENMGSWPVAAKVIFAIILAVLVASLSYFMLIDSKIDELQTAERKETELKQEYRKRYALSSKLDLYKQQMVEMENTFSFANYP